jgi:hypothetical protein
VYYGRDKGIKGRIVLIDLFMKIRKTDLKGTRNPYSQSYLCFTLRMALFLEKA